MLVDSREPAGASNPLVSVIIVTWNCSDLIVDCLDSLKMNAGDIGYEIIVVDNASSDGTLEVLRSRFPQVKILANRENLGFARANNQAMSVALAPLYCLLNPDVLVQEPDFLNSLCKRMETYPEIGAAGCRLIFPDGKHQVGDAGGEPSITALACHAFFISRLFRRRFRGIFLIDGSIQPPYGKVCWVCGACTILRRQVFEQTGGFDESYFLYGEDVEWGCRMSSMGIVVAYFPDINLVHLKGGTQIDSRSHSTRWIDGIAKLFYESNNGRNWRLFKSILFLGFVLRAITYGLIPGQNRSREMLSYGKYVLNLGQPN